MTEEYALDENVPDDSDTENMYWELCNVDVCNGRLQNRVYILFRIDVCLKNSFGAPFHFLDIAC